MGVGRGQVGAKLHHAVAELAGLPRDLVPGLLRGTKVGGYRGEVGAPGPYSAAQREDDLKEARFDVPVAVVAGSGLGHERLGLPQHRRVPA